MSFDLIQPIRFCITIIKYLGLWRLDNQWETIYRAYSYILHFIFTILNIFTLWASVLTANDLEKFTESLYMTLTESALLAKVINILNLNREAVHFFQLVELEDLSLKNSEELKIFERAHRIFYMVGRFYVGASLAVIVAGFTVVAFGPNWTLPYPAWMPFDIVHSKLYWLAFGFQLIGLTVTCLSNISIDMLQCYFLHHISLIYEVIGYRLSKIGFNLDNVCDSLQVNQLILKDLTEILKVHRLVRRMTTKCERFMTFPFFMQILLSALVLCFTGYQLKSTSPLDNPGSFIGTLDFLFVMGLQIFLPCYYANQASFQSGKLSEALYQSNWIDLPQKSRKLIYLYMVFLKKPVVIKSGHFFHIGLPIFGKTINNAYSYFAVLIQMKK